jgi:hypothetical protein
MFKPILLVLIPCCLYALTLSRDTIYSWQYDNIYGWVDTLLVNNTPDTVKVDSLSIKVVESHTTVFGLGICFFMPGNCYHLGDDVGGLTSRQSFSVPPQGVLAVRRNDVCLDMCCICPTFKAAAAAAINDPLVVMLYFYSAGGTDSLTIVSIQKIGSMNVRNNAPVKPKIARNQNPNVYNLRGQAVKINEVTSVEINKGDKQVKVGR